MHWGRARRITALGIGVLVVATACATKTAELNPPGSAGGADWGRCEGVERVSGTTMECTTIEVPADWNTPDNGETMEIALLRARSDTQTDKIGSLVINPGGPGGSGVDFAAYLAETLPAEILSRFDIVGFDPRGVSRSTPVDCISDSDKDAINGFSPDPVSDTDFQALVALQQSAVGACYSAYGDGLARFASAQAAHDIDAIRTAVGDPQLTYLGFSYGTLLGALYAQQNGGNLRAAVLDGAVDPGQDDVATSEGQAAAFELAFDNFATWCENRGTSCELGADPRKYVMDLLAKADASPPVANGRQATSGWILTAVIAALYDESAWPYLSAGLSEANAGNPDLVFQIADGYVGRSATGEYDNSTDAFTAVTCSDDASVQTVEEIRGFQGQWRAKYPMFGAPLATTLLPCALWQAPRAPYPTGPATGGPTIVVVGTKGDPATPYANTAKLAAQLGTGEVLTWEGEGHTAYPKTPCIADAVNGYLIDLTVPPTGTVCPAR
ncbi:alpha/beta hydrolase [Phytomonospora endophytica]|uniref:Pimeloyl-ACP methyl ester carboxylesterase n=1 Tax=Phytomonospora endophytica TaxID=714109 RepID=A0A841FFC0_9ACTN|nr:alpha/beta hydrolase [Phytomonospora endophytica]MBB6034966.1 pimeloyl-ACP methyl ester carboxylesterase [Phytomonospora endophytica]GIG70668.1 proteinase [Phytomonospora endophytica]